MKSALALRTLLSPILAALALTACTSDPAKVDENLFPKDYKQAIWTLVKDNQMPDPTNIREAQISEPSLRPIDKGTDRYVVCVRFNPRNEKHQYDGPTERLVYFYHGQVTQFLTANDNECSWATYKPFPELEKICLGDKCN
jgi:hypothetical protein